jgi:hypothetical protein
MKLVYAMALGLAAAWLTARLARPLSWLRGPALAAAAVVLTMAVLGLFTLAGLPGAERAPALLGRTWATCPTLILVVSLPALAALLWALRGLAPTRLRQAGAAAGLCAGALGAAGYSLHCPEAAPAFVALWYSLGMGLTAVAGALLGPRVLRW